MTTEVSRGIEEVETEIRAQEKETMARSHQPPRALIPDLNLPYEEKEESTEGEIVLPRKNQDLIKSGTRKASSPPTIVMACRACRLYMTVPSNNRKCLKCGKGTSLIDVSTEVVHTKKKRRTM